MSTRRSSLALFVALACGGMVASSGAFAIAACSSSSDDSGSGDSGGSDAPAEGQRPFDSSPDPDSSKPTVAQCRAKCKAEHPLAVPKEDAIDKCWADNCPGPCIDQTGDFDAGDDADADGGVVDAGGLVCGTMVPSGINPTCDRCTEAFCCTSWKDCYNDPDCNAYDKCYGACK